MTDNGIVDRAIPFTKKSVLPLRRYKKFVVAPSHKVFNDWFKDSGYSREQVLFLNTSFKSKTELLSGIGINSDAIVLLEGYSQPKNYHQTYDLLNACMQKWEDDHGQEATD